MPSSFVWNGETVTISESWIDRASVDAPFVLSFCYTINTSKKRLNAPTFEPMESALFGGKLKLQSKTHVSNNCCTGVVHIWELYPKRKQTFEVRVLDSVGMSTVLVFDLSDFLQGAWDKDFMDRAKKNGILQGY